MASESAPPDKIPGWHVPPNGYFQVEQTPENPNFFIEVFSSLDIYCSVCYPVSRNLGAFSRLAERSDEDPVAITKWQFELKELASSAEAGCHFCSFMACRFFDDVTYSFVWGATSTSTQIACCGDGSRTERTERVSSSLARIRTFLQKHTDANFTLVVEPFDYSKDRFSFGRIRISGFQTTLEQAAVDEILGSRSEIILELCAHKDDPAARYVQGRPISISPASDDSINQAKAWIEECLDHHSECPGPTISKFPTRVIKILDHERLELCTRGDFGSYTILSYCWGGPQTFSTTLETFERHKKGFNCSELPQTLQDAIQLTRRLGLTHIWIDSLCIIQDSDPDKDQEIPRMSLYYANSYVTICAGSSKCYDGFLQVHNECENHPGSGVPKDLLKLPYLCPDGKIGTVYFREQSPYFLSWEPISRRAWTLQEQLLSPRVLLYGSRILWQCHTVQHSDGGVEDWSFDLRASDHQKLLLDPRRDNRAGRKDSQDDESLREVMDISDVWYRAISGFSSRKLTFPEDKLPAISGVATVFSKLSGDEYVAGLWRSQLLRELMWSTYPELRLIRPAAWRAPSWSWASVDNDITFSRLPPKDATPLARIISCSATPRSAISPFTQISEASLEIEGVVMVLRRDVVGNFLKRENCAPVPEGKGHDFRRWLMNVSAKRHEVETWEPPENIALLPLFSQPILPLDDQQVVDENIVTVSGLVLDKRDGDVYERIGSFTTLKMRDVSNLETRGKRVKII